MSQQLWCGLPRPLIAVCAVAATCVLVLLASSTFSHPMTAQAMYEQSTSHDQIPRVSYSSSAAHRLARQNAARQDVAKPQSLSTPSVQSGDDASPAAPSKAVLLVKTASLWVSLHDFPISAYAEEIAQMLAVRGGFVASSRIYHDHKGQNHQLSLKVPAAQLDAVLLQLRAVGGPNAILLSEELTTEEVTDEYFDLDTRVNILEESRAEYVRLLRGTAAVSEILAVQAALQPVVSQLEMFKGKKKQLLSKIEFATIHLYVSESVPQASEVLFSFSKTVASSVRSLMGIVSGVLTVGIFLAVVVSPVVIVLGISYWIFLKVALRPDVARWWERWQAP